MLMLECLKPLKGEWNTISSYDIEIFWIIESEITSSDIFLLSFGAVEDRNNRERASPKSIADTCVQYCHLGCP